MRSGSLSSRWTGVYKYVLFPGWTAFTAYAAYMLPTPVPGHFPQGPFVWAFFAFLIIGFVGFSVFAVRVKWVAVRGGSLVATSPGWELTIHPGELLGADLVPLMRPFIVRLRYQSIQGREKAVWFMPKVPWPGRPVDDNLLPDLNALVQRSSVPAA